MDVLGIDVGGSGIKGAPVDLRTGKFLDDRFRVPTPEQAKPEPVAEVVAKITRYFQWQGPVGCGFPAAIRSGVCLTAANIHKKWLGVNVSNLFAEATGCPVSVINDADAAGMAEMAFGAGVGRKGVVLVVTIGTGLGTAVFIDGVLLPNTELGHIEIRGKDAELRASDAARQRGKLSWKRWGLRFNEYLERLEHLFWPDLFILGGGASKKHESFLPYVRVKTEVIPAKLLNSAGIVGAALAVDGPLK